MKTVISCVVDDHPKFLMQAWNLACSLMEVGDWPSPKTTFLLHHTPSVSRKRLKVLENMGAKLVEIEPFGTGNAAYCNKLRQLETAEVQAADVALLLDADVVAARSLHPILESKVVRGKIVDYPNPPAEIWKELLEGTPFHETSLPGGAPSLCPKSWTPATNFNGGVYVLPQHAIKVLATLWPKWSLYCLANSDRLHHFAQHSDQMGFALAMLESGLSFAPLELGQNFPLHLQAADYEAIAPCTIEIIHYHWQMDDHGLPKPLGLNWIDEQVREVSTRIARRRRAAFDNGIFWDFRYSHAPELGSGVGSRGDVLAYKQARLAPFFQIFADGPVVDVGCGDLETARHMPINNYLGLDISPQALDVAREKRPDWSFTEDDISSLDDNSAALVTCLDVLIHQGDVEAVESLIDNLLRVAREAVIVSGYQSPPEHEGIVFSHLPLVDRLKAHSSVERVFEIGSYRGLTMVVAEKRRSEPVNPSDIALEALVWGVANSPTAGLLLELVCLSRTVLSFFPQTVIRTIEYPWIASRLRESRRQRILDIGAGISVVPLWLARRGAQVTTVDNHPNVREYAKRFTWNEWGFLDFGQIDARITSHHTDVATFCDPEGFDVIYSISVIEHMPAELRRRIIARLPTMLRRDGRLLLTLDLVPGTDNLWPLSEGFTVDETEPHGDLSTIVNELEASGFQLIEKTLVRAIPGSRTDIAMLDLRRCAE